MGSLNVYLGPSARTTSFTHYRPFDRSQRRSSGSQSLNKPKGRGQGQKPSPLRGAHFEFQASEHTLRA